MGVENQGVKLRRCTLEDDARHSLAGGRSSGRTRLPSLREPTLRHQAPVPSVSRQVTLREAGELLGYSYRTLTTYRSRRDDFPTETGSRRSAKLYDLAQLHAYLYQSAPRALVNRRATRHDDGDAITCLECGARLQSLGKHLPRHGLTGDEYRAKHNLPLTTALTSTRARARGADAITPERAAHLTQDPARQAERAAIAAQRTPAAHTRAGVAERRAPGQAKGVRAMEAAHRCRMDERMRQLGYADLPAAVEATRHLTITDAAVRLGSSKSAVRRWRGRFPGRVAHRGEQP